MADWNQERARGDHKWIIDEIIGVRDGITRDVVDYYYDAPQTEEEETKKRESMRRYLRDARDRINRLLDNQLAR